MLELRKLVRRIRQDGYSATWHWAWHWLQVHYSSRRLGFSRPPRVDLGQVGVEDAGQRRHEPTNYPDFRRAMRAVHVRDGQDVFLDLGSGMGAAVVMAARYPFRRVMGVEISPRLNSQAQELLLRLRPRLRCKEFELVVADAAEYEIPNDVTVVHMYNPFRGKVLQAALERLRQSLERHPRELTLIVKNTEYLGDLPPWMTEVKRFRCFPNHECAVFRCR